MMSSAFLAKVAPVRSQLRNVRVAAVSNGAKVTCAAKPSWLPGSTSPEYLDGSLPGDYGFDPLGLGKDVTTLARLREAEIINARWAMLGVTGVVSVEALGYGDWLSAATVSQQTYFGTDVPFSLSTVIAIQFVAMAYLEGKRNEETDPEKRCYPGGAFDPMGMSNDAASFEMMKKKEIANGRTAMVAMLGVYAQTSTGSTPVANWLAHISDPWHVSVASNAAAIPYIN